ncbi:MAG: winged helix DNA-binding domain-containing protein [Mycobacteriaceae bacterium]|nr:winged helix DNA-binding domain-containing protein [Mycobacteriaceae bacterium]
MRLVAQGLAGPGASGPTAAVQLLTCVQAQDFPGAAESVALRADGGDVRAALDAGAVVRSWPMRGTLHFTAAEDLGWMLELTTGRLIRGAAKRRESLDLDLADIERARELAVAALSGTQALRREEMLAVWDTGGVSTAGQRGYHLIWHLSQTGTLCWGPMRDGAQALVLLDEWVRTPRRLERDEALGEWVLRYFLGHGPATVKDAARWIGLTAGDVKTGLAHARPRLERIEVDGVEYLMDPELPDRYLAHRDQAEAVHVLPGFDEFMLGYGDRSAALPDAFAQRICPGNNGMFRGTVVHDGQVVGTWKRAGSGRRKRIEAEPFTDFAPAVLDRLGAESQAPASAR